MIYSVHVLGAGQERGVGASEEKMAMLLWWPITKNSMACFVSCVQSLLVRKLEGF